MSNYDHLYTEDILKVLLSMPRLEELELCNVHILDPDKGPVVFPQTWPVHGRSLRRLALEACNITEGYADAFYNLFFRFLTIFKRIERLRLVATIFEPGNDMYCLPRVDHSRLPAVTHLEVEGTCTHFLGLFRTGTCVRGLLSLHLSRCFASWERLDRVTEMVRTVSPTLQQLAFRPNLRAQSAYRVSVLFRNFADAVAQCTELRELEFGQYGRPADSSPLFKTVLAGLRTGRLRRLAFVLDLGDSLSPDIVPWKDLDKELDRVCAKFPLGRPLEIRIQRGKRRNVPAGYYADSRFWEQRLPEMHTRARVVDTERTGSKHPADESYAHPERIDVERIGRISTSRLRSLYDV